MDPSQPSGAVTRLKTLLHRVLVWSVCALVGWLGARMVSSAPSPSASSPPAIHTQESAVPRADNKTLPGATLHTGQLSVSRRQEAVQQERAAGWLLHANGLVPRDYLLGLLSNAAPALTNLAEARSTALSVLSVPQLYFLSSESNAPASGLKFALDPTLRRRISIVSNGKVRSSALRHTGNPEDDVPLEHPSDVAATEFAPRLGSTNATVAIRYANREVIVWNAELAVLQARFTNVAPSDSMELSADGTTAVLTRPAFGITEWRSLRGGRFQSGMLPTPGVTHGIPSPNGQTLATWSSPNAPIHFIRVQDGQKTGSLPSVHYHDQLQWSPDSHWIAVAGPDGFISIWRSDSFQLVSTFRQPDAKRGSWTFWPGRPTLLALDSAGTLSLRDLWTGTPQLQVSTEGYSFQASPDGGELWIQRQGGHVVDKYRLDWFPTWSSPVRLGSDSSAAEYPLVWDETGSIFGVGAKEGLQTYRVGSGYQGTVRIQDPIVSLQRLPGSGELWVTTTREILSGTLSGLLAPGANESWKQILRAANEDHLETTATTNGSTFALRYADRISIHTRGKRTLEIRTVAPASGIELSPDGRMLAVTSSKGGVQIVATSAGTVLWTSPEKHPCTARFSPEGSWLAVGTAQHYDAWSMGEFSRRWRVHRGIQGDWRPAMDFSPDGAWLACGGGLDDLRVLNATDGAEHFRLGLSSAGAVVTLRFSPNQRHLIALQSSGRATVWDLDGLKAGLTRLGLGWEKP